MALTDNTKRITNALESGKLATVQPMAEASQGPSPGRPGRIGLWALAIGFGGFLLWAAFAPLDEGVPSAGIVSIDTKRRPVQHQAGGIVKDVLVGEGDHVKEGQVLIRLDAAVAKANFEATRQRYLFLRAIQGRLTAEQTGAGTINWHPDLQGASSDPMISQQMQNQQQLFQARREGLRADLQSIDENIRGQEALIQSYEGILGNRRNQLALLNEELGNTRNMVKEGYAPRNRQLELERNVSESSASIAELTGNIIRARRGIGDLQQRTISRKQDYRKEIESQLSDVARDVQSEEGKYTALRADLDRIEIKSPATGQVVALSVQTAGGVIQAGQKLMDIVPDNEPLVLEVRVAPHMIDRVHAGLPVDVRFTSFSHSPQLVVHGKVSSVSGDLLTDQGGNSFFLARAVVTPEGLKQLGNRRLQPGMPVEVVFTTGERSMLTYLLNPLTKRVAAAMKEE